ncbi:hypothetical protein [Kibdelosporangium phytohabitans]|uniref:Uncharacterized protein n=1 Tax=Kibdelosporangium phytohabitans TaxID=860235 RepID=A0A0N9HY30_9PSEU|nr:hypothetical protein [Kibdelosporangium phytohabitans]ALG10341.1 hypothetical protein AOZ06_28685 [Kibdelosporangium phytohabitans]MBE1461386.1 hypothetical protein [Kibdelosporangium phytohabitans]
MTESSRANDISDTPGRGNGAFRPLLWLALIITASGNVVASTADLSVLVNVAFGLGAVACAAVLIVHHYRYRRRNTVQEGGIRLNPPSPRGTNGQDTP